LVVNTPYKFAITELVETAYAHFNSLPLTLSVIDRISYFLLKVQ